MSRDDFYNRRRENGRWGEAVALQYLLRHGYYFCERNFRCHYGEIDIIVKKDDALIFVEVKMRSGNAYWPHEAVDSRKQIKIIHSADYYLQKHHLTDLIDWRIDVIEIVRNQATGKLQMQHFENAIERKNA